MAQNVFRHSGRSLQGQHGEVVVQHFGPCELGDHAAHAYHAQRKTTSLLAHRYRSLHAPFIIERIDNHTTRVRQRSPAFWQFNATGQSRFWTGLDLGGWLWRAQIGRAHISVVGGTYDRVILESWVHRTAEAYQVAPRLVASGHNIMQGRSWRESADYLLSATHEVSRFKPWKFEKRIG